MHMFSSTSYVFIGGCSRDWGWISYFKWEPFWGECSSSGPLWRPPLHSRSYATANSTASPIRCSSRVRRFEKRTASTAATETLQARNSRRQLHIAVALRTRPKSRTHLLTNRTSRANTSDGIASTTTETTAEQQRQIMQHSYDCISVCTCTV